MSNQTTFFTSIATFDRANAHRISFKDVFTCDAASVQNLMFKHAPKEYDMVAKQPNEIKIGNVGFEAGFVSIVGSVYHGEAIYQIPIEEAKPFMTDYALDLIEGFSTTPGAMGNLGTSSTGRGAIMKYQIKLHNEFATISSYKNPYTNDTYQIQLDNKYSWEKDGSRKDASAKNIIYIQVPSNDENKIVYLEINKEDVSDNLISLLEDQLKKYTKWLDKQKENGFVKYKDDSYGVGSLLLRYYRKDLKTWSNEDSRDFKFYYLYDKRKKTTSMVIQSSKQDVKKNLSVNGFSVVEDRLSQWTIKMENPQVELKEIIDGLKTAAREKSWYK